MGEGEAPAEPLTLRVKGRARLSRSFALPMQGLRPLMGSTGWAEHPFSARLPPESFPACGGTDSPGVRARKASRTSGVDRGTNASRVPPGRKEVGVGVYGIPAINRWANLACSSGTIRPAASAVPEGQTKRIRRFRCRVADGRPLPASRRDKRNKPSVFNAGLTNLSIPLRPGWTRERKARLSGEVLRPSAPALPAANWPAQ